MTENTHTYKATPPAFPQVILRAKEAYQVWLAIHRNFPKTERFGIGQKIENAFLNLLEYGFATTYLPLEQKIILLNKTISHLDVLKFFVQLAWESKLIPTEKYADFISRLEEIGRQLGGWKKGLQTKTPR
jgi:hypothetical protein